jgi:hypothetical protein
MFRTTTASSHDPVILLVFSPIFRRIVCHQATQIQTVQNALIPLTSQVG